jgi:murein L,D-transpeptidase YcbB/YkuD
VDQAVAAGRTQRIALRRTTPLYVVYWKVIAEPSGDLLFRPDVYGWDAKLNAALAGVAGRGQVRPSTDCADPED